MKFSGADGEKEMFIFFPVQLTTSRIGSLTYYPVDLYSATCDGHALDFSEYSASIYHYYWCFLFFCKLVSIFLLGGVFRPCDDGLDFDSAHSCENSINQSTSNQNKQVHTATNNLKNMLYVYK